MSAIKQLPARLDVEFIAGKPFTFTVQSTGATVTSPAMTVRSSAGDPVAVDFTDVLQLGADSVFSINAADSVAWNTSSRARSYRYEFSAVVDGFGPYAMCAGTITAHPVGTPGTSSASTAALAVTVGDTSISLGVSVGGDVTGHIADTVGAHAASAISVADAGGYFVGDDVEGVLQEIAASFARTFQAVTLVTAASYTFTAADQADIVVGNSASAQTFTIPPTSSVPATIGTAISVFQKGAGAISFVGDSGVTLVLAPGTVATTAGAGAAVTATLVEPDTWYLSGALSRSDVHFVPANLFGASRGLPTLSNFAVGVAEASPVVWLLDASTRESVTANVVPPWGWNAARVDIWWGNLSTSSGDVVWEITYQAPIADGDTLSASGTAVNVTAAAPTGTARDVKVTTVLASLPLAPGKLVSFGISRRASDAADTLPNDCRFAGVSLTRLS
jgi:hypothetical protein